MNGEPLPATQRRLLDALSTYRLLNPQQMLRVGVANSVASIRLEARVLKRKKLIGQSRSHLVAGVTTLPRLHWLTDSGAEILVGEGEEEAIGARREMGDATQITHRIKIVDMHIALRQWAVEAGRRVNWFVTDFEPGAGGLRKPTTIEYDAGRRRFTPDALADLIGPDDQSRLLVLEIERGRRDGKRLTEFRKKLDQLREVSAGRIVEDHFGRPKHRARFLIVFARADTRDKMLATWPDPDADAWSNFFVKSDDEMVDFNEGWWRPGGRSQRPLFPFGPAAPPQTNLPLPVV